MSKFKDIVRGAARAELEYRDLTANTRMSASAIVNKCLELAGSNPEKLESLERTLEERGSFMRWCQGFIRQVERQFTEGRINSGVPQSIARMALPSRDEAIQELAAHASGHSPHELWALACQRASMRHPEVFGQIEDAGAHQERVDELRERRDELYGRIAKGFGPEDINLDDVRASTARVTIKIAPEVPLGPLNTLGERLVTHLLATEPERWTVKQAPQPLRNARRGRPGLPVAGAA